MNGGPPLLRGSPLALAYLTRLSHSPVSLAYLTCYRLPAPPPPRAYNLTHAHASFSQRASLRRHWRRFRYGPRYAPGEAVDGIVTELSQRRSSLIAAGCLRGAPSGQSTVRSPLLVSGPDHKHAVTILVRAAEDARRGPRHGQAEQMEAWAAAPEDGTAREGLGHFRAAPVARSKPLSLAQLEELVRQKA